jgi:hypothetical protein
MSLPNVNNSNTKSTKPRTRECLRNESLHIRLEEIKSREKIESIRKIY